MVRICNINSLQEEVYLNIFVKLYLISLYNYVGAKRIY